MEKKIINEITRIQELMSKKILVEGGTPTLFTKLIKFFEKNAGDDGLPFLFPSSSELKLVKAEKSFLRKFDIILNLAKTNKNIRNQLIKFVNAGIPPAELQKLNNLKTFLIKYSNKDKTILKNTVNKKLDLMMTNSKVREIIKLDFDDYVDNLKPTPKIKTTKKPKVTKNAKVTTPTSEFSPDTSIKNLLSGTGEITEQKILAAANKDFENIFAKHKITIPLESIADFNETLISRLKRAIPNEFDKTFDNMMKTYKAIDNPVERKKFFTKIADDLNINLNAGLKEIESSTGIKFISPNLFDKLNNFLTQNFFGKHLLGGKFLNTKPSGFLKAMLYMSGVASFLHFLDAMFTAMTPTKDNRSFPKMVGDDIKDLWDSMLNGKSLSREYWQNFMFKHFAPFVNVITYSAQSLWDFFEMIFRQVLDIPKDVTPKSDDDDNKSFTIEKGKDKLLQIFKSSLSKVEPKILDKYLNNITVGGNELILTDNGTVYEIHNPLLGENAFIVNGENKYMFTNKMFTE